MMPLVSASNISWELPISTIRGECNVITMTMERSLTILQIHHSEVLGRRYPSPIFTPKSCLLTKPDSHNLRSFNNNPIHNSAFSAPSFPKTCFGIFGFWAVARHFSTTLDHNADICLEVA
jgi:hypothetical protein